MADVNTDENKKSNDPEVTKCEEPKTSIDLLRESKPSENIALDPDLKVSSTIHTVFKTELDAKESPLHRPQLASSQEEQGKSSKSSMAGETSTSNVSCEKRPQGSTESTTISTQDKTSNIKCTSNQAMASQGSGKLSNSLEKKQANTDITEPQKSETNITNHSVNKIANEKVQPSSCSMPVDSNRSLNRKSSEVSAKDIEYANAIFSVSGAQSRKIFRKRETPSSIFPVGCMGCKEEAQPQKVTQKASQDSEKSVASSSTSLNRNPLTGYGIEATDEVKLRATLRKDGNPVLGVGYDKPFIRSSNSRIPPGGYSKGLW